MDNSLSVSVVKSNGLEIGIRQEGDSRRKVSEAFLDVS